jgi:hypothetical protein
VECFADAEGAESSCSWINDNPGQAIAPPSLYFNAPRQLEATALAPATRLAWKFRNAVDQTHHRTYERTVGGALGKEPKSPFSDRQGGAEAAQVKERKVKAQSRAPDEHERSFSAVCNA